MVGRSTFPKARLYRPVTPIGLVLVAILATSACMAPGINSSPISGQQSSSCHPVTPGVVKPTPGAATEIRASLDVEVAAVGDSVCITGQGLGSRRGEISFFSVQNIPIDGRISSWSDTAIRVTVPPAATTGPVQGRTAADEPFYPGPLVIEGAPNGVSRITYRPISPVVASQAATVTLIATNSSGQPVPAVRVYLTDGLGTLSCTTDSGGVCSLSVTGYASATFIAISGTAWTHVPVTWVQPPTQTMSLTTSATALLIGASATIAAAVKDSNGDPVPNQLVLFAARGTAPVRLSASQVATDAAGIATITAVSPAAGVAFMDVETNYHSIAKFLEIDWAPALVNGLSPNHGSPSGGTAVTVSGSGFNTSATVYFGPQPAIRVTFVNSSTLMAVAPPGSGKVDVRIGIGGSFSPMVPNDLFTYS
jgi:hypothetical protein